jgi:hypothetical protein
MVHEICLLFLDLNRQFRTAVTINFFTILFLVPLCIHSLPRLDVPQSGSTGGGSVYLKLGRKVLYRRGDLADWLNARRVATTQAALTLPHRLTDAVGD